MKYSVRLNPPGGGGCYKGFRVILIRWQPDDTGRTLYDTVKLDNNKTHHTTGRHMMQEVIWGIELCNREYNEHVTRRCTPWCDHNMVVRLVEYNCDIYVGGELYDLRRFCTIQKRTTWYGKTFHHQEKRTQEDRHVMTPPVILGLKYPPVIPFVIPPCLLRYEKAFYCCIWSVFKKYMTHDTKRELYNTKWIINE